MAALISVKSKEDKTILLEQYRIAIDSINKLGDVRERLNTWWTGIHSALVGVISYFRNIEELTGTPKQIFLWTIIILGFLLCYTWLSSLLTIKTNIERRSSLLTEFEKHLPVKVFTLFLYERGGEKSKASLSFKEALVPLLFLLGYVFFACILYFYPHLARVL